MKLLLISPRNFSLELQPPNKRASATFAPQPSVSATAGVVVPTGEYRDKLTPTKWTGNTRKCINNKTNAPKPLNTYMYMLSDPNPAKETFRRKMLFDRKKNIFE